MIAPKETYKIFEKIETAAPSCHKIIFLLIGMASFCGALIPTALYPTVEFLIDWCQCVG